MRFIIRIHLKRVEGADEKFGWKMRSAVLQRVRREDREPIVLVKLGYSEGRTKPT